MHMHLSVDRSDPTETRLLLDDVDVTRSVMASGFRIEIDEHHRPVVSMQIRPDSLTVEGDAVIQAALAELTPTDQEVS